MIIIFFIYFCGIFSFCINRVHLLLILLSLEFVVLRLYYGLFIYLISFFFEFFFCIIFLTIIVCEGALGLRILVSIVRGYGSDNFQSLNLLW
jgi:NADH-ubiquinone oxidoreductase chain 4L